MFGIARAIQGEVVGMMLEQFQYGKDAQELRATLGRARPLIEQYLGRVRGIPPATSGSFCCRRSVSG